MLISVRDRDWDEYHRLENRSQQMMELLGDVGQMEARFVLFRDNVNPDAKIVVQFVLNVQ
jgi:hypothetical protein